MEGKDGSPAAQGKETEETAETERRGRRAPELPPSSSGRGWGGFERRLQAAALTGGFERRWRLRVAAAASTGGG
jgi:hypothetical protein